MEQSVEVQHEPAFLDPQKHQLQQPRRQALVVRLLVLLSFLTRLFARKAAALYLVAT
jgi:hypothetical protein